jgi:hypothetical protein
MASENKNSFNKIGAISLYVKEAQKKARPGLEGWLHVLGARLLSLAVLPF